MFHICSDVPGKPACHTHGRQAGTFGDVGVFSFAEGENMPCLGGGAIATGGEAVARRAEAILAKAATPATTAIV
jgi:dTDP-4-amino-4,6-dideoxygalactose transaminase